MSVQVCAAVFLTILLVFEFQTETLNMSYVRNSLLLRFCFFRIEPPYINSISQYYYCPTAE